MSYREAGIADDPGYNGWSFKHRRRNYYGDSNSDYDDDGDPYGVTMAEVEERELSILFLVDSTGGELWSKDMRLNNISLIPKDPFENADTDKREYEGYMGNVYFSSHLKYSDV